MSVIEPGDVVMQEWLNRPRYGDWRFAHISALSTLAWLGLAGWLVGWLVGWFPVILSTYTTYEYGTDSVPKRRHIKFRRWGITQMKEYDIQNMAKVGNQEHITCLDTVI